MFVELPDLNNKHLLVTVANFRKQNHFRQLEVMRILKNDGFNIMWLNIGGSVDIGLISRLKAKIKEYGLEDSFILKESDPNPYKYMAIADAVTVLSDNESWSLVITEAKYWGFLLLRHQHPALEQITHGETE